MTFLGKVSWIYGYYKITFLVTGGGGFIGSAIVMYIINITQDYVVNVDRLTGLKSKRLLEAVKIVTAQYGSVERVIPAIKGYQLVPVSKKNEGWFLVILTISIARYGIKKPSLCAFY